jgi:hypothetical protein
MPENIKLVIGAKNFSVQSEAGFFNRIGQQQTFNTKTATRRPPSMIL